MLEKLSKNKQIELVFVFDILLQFLFKKIVNIQCKQITSEDWLEFKTSNKKIA